MLLEIIAERDKAMAQVAQNAGPCFMARALKFVVSYLREHGEASGEKITDACWDAGIEAHDRRAIGPVLMRLSKDKLIEKAGTCIRKRGHGCSGGNLWRLKK